MMENSVSVVKKQDAVIVTINKSDFDYELSQHFKNIIVNLIVKYPLETLIIDFSNVTLIDGYGLATLIFCNRSCENKEIKMIVCCLKESVLLLVRQKAIDKIIEITENVHSALDIGSSLSRIKQKFVKCAKNIEDVFGNPFDDDERLDSTVLV